MLVNLQKLFTRIGAFYRRYQHARKIGTRFSGVGRFQLPQSILLNNQQVALKLNDEHSTGSAFIDIFLDDCYGLEYFKQKLPGIKTIIDIGANQGIFTLQARNFFKEADIWAYEPNKTVLPALAWHAEITGTRFFNEAVGLTAGKIVLRSTSDTFHGKSFSSDDGDINQVSFQACLLRAGGSADLVKLDCEGAEWEILQDKESLGGVRAITLEYHLDEEHMAYHQNSHQAIIDLLTVNHFTIRRHSILHTYWGIVWASK